MSRPLEARVARLAATKTVRKLGYKRWHKLVLRAIVAESFDKLPEKDQAIIERAEQEILATNASIYLDIDGVLLHVKKNKTPIGVNYLLKTLNNLIVDGVGVYWLTTHCDGDASTAVKYLAPYIKKPLSRTILGQIKSTSWTVKTQGIDFSKPFLWFDDKPLGWADREVMEKHRATDSLIIVDLEKQPLALIFIALKLKRMLNKVSQNTTRIQGD